MQSVRRASQATGKASTYIAASQQATCKRGVNGGTRYQTGSVLAIAVDPDLPQPLGSTYLGPNSRSLALRYVITVAKKGRRWLYGCAVAVNAHAGGSIFRACSSILLVRSETGLTRLHVSNEVLVC